MKILPYRKNGRGNWRIKANFRAVAGIRIGKLDVPLGTTDEKLARSIEDSLRGLPKLGEHGAQLLLDLRDRRRSGVEIHELVRGQNAKGIPLIFNAESLESAWGAFHATAKKKGGARISVRTQHDYRLYLNYFLEMDSAAVVHDLPRLLERFKDTCINGDQPKPETYRKVWSAAKSFARNTQPLKQFSELYQQIQRVGGASVPESNVNLAMPVYEVRELIERIRDPRIQRICWTLALTGMSVGEYVNNFVVTENSIEINGEKNHRRKRSVPKLSDELEPVAFSYYVPGKGTIKNTVAGERVSHDVLNDAVRDASGGSRTSNVFRHCYALWLEECPNIPGVRVRLYTGWAPAAEDRIKDNYTKAEKHRFLSEDAAAMHAYTIRNWKRPPASKSASPKRLRLSFGPETKKASSSK